MLKKKKATTVGWIVDPKFGDFAFFNPESLKSKRGKPLSNRAVQACPAVNELERRLFEVQCPFNIQLEIEKSEQGYDLFVVDHGTRLDDDLIGQYVMLMRPDLWRDKDTPVLQISTPYIFVCDDDCYMSQLPPFMDTKHHKWPGVITSGRFPSENWPRVLNWAFEWADITKTLTLKRGDPLFYVYFETNNPSLPVRLVMAKNTEELKEFRKGINGIPKFISNTFKAMEIAKSRRPKKLLTPMEK